MLQNIEQLIGLPYPLVKILGSRMSGLVWPEAAQRIANSAYLTRERVGKGKSYYLQESLT